jgi:hypothetical protein
MFKVSRSNICRRCYAAKANTAKTIRAGRRYDTGKSWASTLPYGNERDLRLAASESTRGWTGQTEPIIAVTPLTTSGHVT